MGFEQCLKILSSDGFRKLEKFHVFAIHHPFRQVHRRVKMLQFLKLLILYSTNIFFTVMLIKLFYVVLEWVFRLFKRMISFLLNGFVENLTFCIILVLLFLTLRLVLIFFFEIMRFFRSFWGSFAASLNWLVRLLVLIKIWLLFILLFIVLIFRLLLFFFLDLFLQRFLGGSVWFSYLFNLSWLIFFCWLFTLFLSSYFIIFNLLVRFTIADGRVLSWNIFRNTSW